MPADSGLNRRLGRDLLLQAVYISLAVLVGVYAAAQLMENLLIEQALQGEAEYYWQREESQPLGPLPDTKNMTGYRDGIAAGIPGQYANLAPGFHRSQEPRETLALVSEREGERLVLVFEVEQVDKLVALFGIIPLALVLIVIYASIYGAYRISRRAVSPVVSLAQAVRQLDPAGPDPSILRIGLEAGADDEIRILSEALQGLIERVGDFADRERRFTRDASHELRTPLTVIKIAVDRLVKDPALSDENLATLQRIGKSATDMEELTTAFLLLARESGEGLEREWVCVNDVVGKELDRYRMINPKSGINTEVKQECRLFVSAPEKVLESVIGNLLRNALAYTDDGSVTAYVTPDHVIIEDTGPGMDQGAVEQVFKPYFRNQRQRGGFGVGLTIVKRLTDRFGWPVEIDSEPSRGTRVLVRFPDARAERTSTG
jgi:signal transduction histidine kinase